MLRGVLAKTFRLVGYTIQYGCIAHCAFEYVGGVVMVPTGHVWLEGDNLQNSTDSRYYGPIPYGLIRGRIFFKIWPLSDFGFLRDSPNGHRFSDD
uniref:Inner mitochondrial membrane peptidase subunit 1 n=1 Tax=Ailuropoda melanoleuca TaxID=9646 RepID=A0A7N5KCS9_AILME